MKEQLTPKYTPRRADAAFAQVCADATTGECTCNRGVNKVKALCKYCRARKILNAVVAWCY